MSQALAHRTCPLLFSFSVQSQLLARSPPEQGLNEASPPILGDRSQPAVKDIWGDAAQNHLLLAALLVL